VIKKIFRFSLSVPALLSKTSSALNRRFNGFLSPWKPCPSSLPDGLDPVGTLALLGFLTSQALSSLPGSNRSLSHRITLSAFASLISCEMGSHDPQGVPRKRLGVLPYGMPACLAFLPFVSRDLFENVTLRGLFFPLEDPQLLTEPMHLLLADDSSSPFGRP
jgi:hypothetical protein